VKFAWAIFVLLGAQIAGQFMSKAQSTQVPKAANFEDFDVPQMEENTPQAVVFGDVWISGWMVLWYGNYFVAPIVVKGGKK